MASKDWPRESHRGRTDGAIEKKSRLATQTTSQEENYNSKSGHSFDFRQISTRVQFCCLLDCLPIIIIIITET